MIKNGESIDGWFVVPVWHTKMYTMYAQHPPKKPNHCFHIRTYRKKGTERGVNIDSRANRERGSIFPVPSVHMEHTYKQSGCRHVWRVLLFLLSNGLLGGKQCFCCMGWVTVKAVICNVYTLRVESWQCISTWLLTVSSIQIYCLGTINNINIHNLTLQKSLPVKM